jgi:Tol biopolymer transport system component
MTRRGAVMWLVVVVLGLVWAPVTGADSGSRSSDGAGDLLWLARWGGNFPGRGWQLSPVQGGFGVSLSGLGVDPAWSPDGQWIASVVGTSISLPLDEIQIQKMDGSSVTKLTSDSVKYPLKGAPTWSPDGSEIAFLSQPFSVTPTTKSDVWVVPFAGGPARRLTKSGVGKGGLAWSPSGASLLTTEGRWIVEISPLTGAETRIVQGSQPVWSPDGGRIAYVDTSGHLALMNADGSSSQELTDISSASPSWSPDGTEVAFTGYAPVVTRFGLGPYTRVDVYTATTDGSAPARRLTGSFDSSVASFGGAQPTFSPDGAYILFHNGHEEADEAWLMNADGSCPHMWAAGADLLAGPFWRPRSVTGGPLACVDLAAYPELSADQVALDQQAKVTVSVENHGNQPAHDVVLHITPTTGIAGINGCSSGQTSGYDCPLGTLAPGGSKSIDVALSSASAGGIGLSYSVTSIDNDLTPGDASGTVSIGVLPCTLVGTQGRDHLQGTPRADRICGLDGSDWINGGAGNDHLDGGPGNDTIIGGPGHDTIVAGPGNDVIHARDGARDRIDCGKGIDTVYADPVDVVARDCEKVVR